MTNLKILQIRQTLNQHESWRKKTLNLIASENLISHAVRQALDNDLVGRYTDYNSRDLSSRRYRGNQFVIQIEREAEALAKRLFRATEFDLRPLSGHIAGASVILGLCKVGDTILEVGANGGSHRMAAKLTQSSAIQLDVHFLPFDQSHWNVDVSAAVAMIRDLRPKIVILGSSAFLFPHPVAELREAMRSITGSVMVYDASHVLGLIGGSTFQDPLAEGVDIVYGSTHKTLPGPQGGIVYSNSPELMGRISTAIYPPLVTNHHSFRIPALANAIDEMLRSGKPYAAQIIANARALGSALDDLGVPPLRFNGQYTASHTLLVPIAQYPYDAAKRLEECGIITSAFRVPETAGEIGLRLGSQEITRMGAVEADMLTVAKLIVTALKGSKTPGQIANMVQSFVQSLPGMAFT